MARRPRIELFISYARADSKYLTELLEHLTPYARARSIRVWTDRDIEGGEKWLEEVRRAVRECAIAVFLVSPSFLNSRFIDREELTPLLRRSERRQVELYWIPIRPSAHKTSRLSAIQAYPDPQATLSLLTKPKRDATLAGICEKIDERIQKSQARPPRQWAERLNRFFDGKVRIFNSAVKSEPRLSGRGNCILTPRQKEHATKIRRKHARKNKPNDRHAILVTKSPAWTDREVSLEFHATDFAGLDALRECPTSRYTKHPPALSANILAVCNATREVLIHLRDKECTTYPKHLHTIGGAYSPPVKDGKDYDRYSLITAGEREFFEETAVSVCVVDHPWHMALCQEQETGFIQLMISGISISMDAYDRCRSNWEGHVKRVSFDDLGNVLRTGKWVPTGKAHVLTWLAAGTPGVSIHDGFNGMPGSELFDSIVPRL